MGNRITPADAGKTRSTVVQLSLRQDHPRGCGENAANAAISTSDTGITPADAGKTIAGYMLRTGDGDHPRGCGENIRFGNFDFMKDGSPPRMRGKH